MSEPKKHPGGRPTKYHEGMPDLVYEYVDSCVDEEDIFHKTRGEKSDTYERNWNVNFPTKEALARHIGVALSTIQEWEKNHQKFSVALAYLMDKQRDQIIRGGMSGRYNSAIAKLVLAANHDMRDKSDITTNGKDMPTPIAKLD